jgi:pimeloyl-ACP methyl ester carboxylesterase
MIGTPPRFQFRMVLGREFMKPTRAFIHGLESTGRGTKGVFFRERYPDMIIEDFFGPFSKRMEKLESLLDGKNELILVGSSYGGLMAAAYACLYEERVKKLILLAPALHLEEYNPCLNKKLHMPTVIFHGLRDDVVPLAAVRETAERLFVNHTFDIVEDDHSLHDTFAALEWDALLSL